MSSRTTLRLYSSRFFWLALDDDAAIFEATKQAPCTSVARPQRYAHSVCIPFSAGAPVMALSGRSRGGKRLGEQEVCEWMLQLGVLNPDEQNKEFRSQLRDGVVLCHLANRLHPGIVETVSGRDGRGRGRETASGWCRS